MAHVMGRIGQTGIFVALLALLNPSLGWSGPAEDALNKGLNLHEAGNLNEAIVQYGRAIKLNRRLAEAYFNRGNAYYDLGKNASAIKDYSEAIRLNPI